MGRVKFSANDANRIYDLLVAEAGAPDVYVDGKRAEFVHWLISDHYGNEFRFMGKLGWGGKLYLEDYRPRLWVECYPEDRTPERAAIIKRTNERLAELLKEGPRP